MLQILLLIMFADVDECRVSNGGCDHNCTNTVGSYHCTCNAGYQLQSDKHSCKGNNWFCLNYAYSYTVKFIIYVFELQHLVCNKSALICSYLKSDAYSNFKTIEPILFLAKWPSVFKENHLGTLAD